MCRSPCNIVVVYVSDRGTKTRG